MKQTRHTKRFIENNGGVELLCGDKVIRASMNICANWSVESCPVCGAYVETDGVLPAEVRIMEYERAADGSLVALKES
jgi:hypothetical protein